MPDQDPRDKVVISSLVVQMRESCTESVRNTIESIAGASIVKAQDHKFAVVLEGESSQTLASLTEQIRSLDGVTGVELVAHFFEEEVLDNPPDP